MPKKPHPSIVVFPSSPEKKVTRICLPPFCWRLITVLWAGILIWASMGTWSLYHYCEISEENRRLGEENRLRKAMLMRERRKVLALDRKLKQIRKQAEFVRGFLGIERPDPNTGALGQGGREVPPNVLSSSPPDLLSQKETGGPLEVSLNRAVLSLKEVDQIHDDFLEIISTLERRQREMECTPSISPVDPKKAWISSAFGMRVSPFTGRKQFHLGLDISGWKGTPIVATAKGKVVFAGKRGLLGRAVKIRHEAGYVTIYGHLLKSVVKRGQKVARGQIIGYMGSSGRSTGYHVHYEVRKRGKPVNPLPYMTDWDTNPALWAQK